MNKKYLKIIFVIFISILLSACIKNEQSEDVHLASIEGIDSIYIDYRSTNVYLISTTEDELKVVLHLFDNGPGVVMDEKSNSINVRVKSHIFRLLKIGQKPQLEVQVPIDYTGDIILDGSSGNINGGITQMKNLQINGRSGNVTFDIEELRGDLDVTLTSGNINASLNNDQTDATVLLKSNSGRRSIDFLLDNLEQTNKITKGTLGSGKYEINLETSSGNILIK